MTQKQDPQAPAAAIIDACCLIDLLVTGHAEAILEAPGFTWHLPVAVQAEVTYVRQRHPAQPGRYLNVPVSLGPYLGSGLLALCQPDDPQEQARFVQYATTFRSDGEAMCLAIAEGRRWVLATDDRKAIRLGLQAGLTIVSCPQLVKTWAMAAGPDAQLFAR